MTSKDIFFWMQPLDPTLPDIVRVNERDLDPVEDSALRSRLVTRAIRLNDKTRHVPTAGGGWVASIKNRVIGEAPVTEPSTQSGRQSVIVATTRMGADQELVRQCFQRFLADHHLEASETVVLALSEGLARAARPGCMAGFR